MAIGHKIIVAAYFIIKNNQEYKEPKQQQDPMNKQRIAQYHLKQIKALGFDISNNYLVPTQWVAARSDFYC